MIGVIADSADQDVVREFFELFKTPWEFYRKDRQYEVLLCAEDSQFDGTAKLVLLYAGRKMHFDDEQENQHWPPTKAHLHPLVSRKSNPNLWGHHHVSGERERPPDG